MGSRRDGIRAQSELVGTVLMISITIIGAVLTVALAGGALQAISDGTQDSLTRDSFHEMDNRLSGLYGSQVSSETTLRFPQGAGSDLTVNESEGSVKIRVETADGYKGLTEEDVTQYEQDLGAIVYEGSNGEKLVYQGGGLWEFPSPSYAVVRSNPPLSRTGQFLTFDFANLRGAKSVGDGEEVVARRDVADSKQRSEDIRAALSPAWTVKDSGYTVPVDISVTIESQYALGWATYAEERLSDVNVSPSPEDMGPGDTEVTLTFENTGTADFLDYPDPIVYAGPASGAPTGFDPRANASIERTGDNEFRVSGDDVNPNQQQQLAFYNESKGEWVIHTKVNDAPSPPKSNGNVGWVNVSEMSDAIDSGSRPTPRWDDSDEPPEIAAYDKNGNGDTYKFSSSYADTRICVVAYTDDNIGNDVDGVIEQLETCASNLENSQEYMPTDLEINLTQDDYSSVVGERQTVEVEVENVGAIESTSAHDVGLFVEDEDGNVRVADFETNESIGDIPTGTTVTQTLNWTAASVKDETLYARVGDQDIDEASVSIEARNTDLTVDINETATPDEVVPGSEVQVSAAITNKGNAPVIDTDVTLLGADGTPVDVVRIDRLEPASGAPDNETDVTLRWNAPVTDFDEELEVQALDANDTTEISAKGTPEFNVEIDDSNTDSVAAEGEPFEVEVDVTNDGGSGGEQQLLLIANTTSTDDLIVNSTELFVGEGDTEPVTLVWDSPVELQSGDNEVIVQSRDDTDSAEFDTEANFQVEDIDVSDTEIDLDPTQEVTVTATINNTGDVSGTPTVELGPATDSSLDIDSASSSGVTIDGGETEEVTFDVTVREGSLTGELAVSTSDDEGTERIVVVREGPDCSEVDYDTDADDYHLVETVDQLQCIEEEGLARGRAPGWWCRWLQCIEEEGLGKNYRLANDIDAYGTEHWNGGDGFEPIGDQQRYADHFSGDFDGQGYKIEGLTIDRYDEPFVGLFAITDDFGSSGLGVGVTIESVELEDIDVRGKTVVGGLAGGAGGTFMNSSVSGRVESQYQQVGGLVGHGHDADLSNQLVSTATVVGGRPAARYYEHPWQDSQSQPNLGIGGIIGGTGYETDVSTAYSRANVEGNSAVGGITGWTSDGASDNEQMYWVGGDLQLNDPYDVVDRSALESPVAPGAIAGRMEVDDDTFKNSVYASSNEAAIGEQIADADAISVDPEDMKGPAILPEGEDDSFYDQYPGVTEEDAEGTMANLDWDIWEPVYDIDPETGEIINEGYPIFAWQAEGGFIVESVDAPDNVTEGESVVVEARISNTQDAADEQRVVLRDPRGNPVNSTELTLDGNEQATVELTWQTWPRDNTTDVTEPEITVSTQDSGDTRPLEVKPLQSPEFLIDDSSASSTDIDELDDVTFTAEIENDGSEGERTVFLEDDNGTILNSTSLYLDEQETETIDLTWQTTFGDAQTDDRSITMRTGDDSVTFDIDVDETDGSDFQVEPIGFPSEQGDTVAVGQPLTVQVEIENQGGVEDTQFVSLMPAGSDEILALEEVTLADGATEEINLTWDPANNPGVEEIKVSTRDDSATENIVLRASQRDPTTNPFDTGVNIFDFD